LQGLDDVRGRADLWVPAPQVDERLTLGRSCRRNAREQRHEVLLRQTTDPLRPLAHRASLGENLVMRSCPQCGGSVERRFRYCPWCASPLRSKLVEFFPAHPRDAGKALRVSRYLDQDPHVRFSVWDETGRVEGAVSVDEVEAERVARFLRPRTHVSRRHGLAALLTYAAGVSARRSSTGSRKTTSS
jgi:hypothetical protein